MYEVTGDHRLAGVERRGSQIALRIGLREHVQDPKGPKARGACGPTRRITSPPSITPPRSGAISPRGEKTRRGCREAGEGATARAGGVQVDVSRGAHARGAPRSP